MGDRTRLLGLSPSVLLFVVAACSNGCDPSGQRRMPDVASAGGPNGIISGSTTSALAAAATTIPGGPLTMQFATPSKNAAVLDRRDPRKAARSCQVTSACKALHGLEPCPKDIRPIDAGAMRTFVPAALGESIAVRGRLGLAVERSTPSLCVQKSAMRDCCQRSSIQVFVGDIANGVRLDEVSCHGDESRLCCDVPAFGQVVTAIGNVTPETDFTVVRHGGRWTLRASTLCSETRPTGARRTPQREGTSTR